MATRISDLSDTQLLQAYDVYLESCTSNWVIGMGLLKELSDRFGNRLEKEFFVTGIKRIVSIKPTLRGREERFFPRDFAIPMPELKELVNELTRDICLAAIEDGAVPVPTGTLQYDVPIIGDLEGYGRTVDGLLGNARGIFTNVAQRRLFTFGSCFAVNVGQILRDKGCSVYTMVVAEDVNSPFNNLQVLNRIFLGQATPIGEELSILSGLDYAAVKREFSEASDIILTLGNIFHLEIDGTPTLNPSGAVLVSETLDESVRYLSGIFALLQEFTQANVFVSVSPVPISGYRGLEFPSAVEADCASKSQLRASFNACRKGFPRIGYIPTFEIFRWLPAHQSFPTFGVDDGYSRHISSTLLKRVLDSFVG